MTVTRMIVGEGMSPEDLKDLTDMEKDARSQALLWEDQLSQVMKTPVEEGQFRVIQPVSSPILISR